MTSPPTTGHKIFGGRYAVEAPLGSGATATVYLCHDRTTTQPVAVKVLHTDLAESVGAERFLREIRLTAGLDHPSILPVIDSGADGSILWCVLPYMEGGTLRDLLREKKQLAIPEAIEIGKTIADALAYAHDRGLIHRDIKPENILFSKGKAFLGDFGIARALYATASDLTTTSTGVIRGTPAYMSPEQASGERNYDGRSDIYSLGAVVYEMISGMPPFVGPTAQSVMAQRFSSTPREMRTYRANVSPDFERVVAKAMATTPADRYATVREFAESLVAAERVHGQPVSRRRAWVMGAAALSVLGIAAIYVGGSRETAGTASPLPDTTQLVVLPFEKQGDTHALGSVDAMLYDAFSAWQGVSVVEPFRVRDAVSRQTASGVVRDRSAALSLGAGRFIRGEIGVLPAGAGWRIQAWLHQVGSHDSVLFHAAVTVAPTDLLSVNRLYARLADELLLRGRDTSITNVTSSTSLPAVQAFAAGLDSLDEWNLVGADKAFEHATGLDAGFTRARFWQAQVRSWRRQSVETWRSLAARAAADSTRLPGRERELARALNALGAGEFQTACDAYRRLANTNPSDFAAWYGLGQCNDFDYQLVPDGRGGLRYRSSYQEAMRAYRRAFSALAISHRGVQGGAFEPLRDLLFMKPSQLRPAVSPTGQEDTYVGRLDRDGDTLVMRAIPVLTLASGGPEAVPEHLADAIALQRDLFRQIVTTWSTALPKSSAAKEGVAISLEMLGDRSALDTLRAARALADDASRLRLAVAEVVVRLKHLEADDNSEAGELRTIVDSLLRSRPKPSVDDARILAPLAVLAGRCADASALVREAPTAPDRRLPLDLNGEGEALTMRRAMGCPAREPSFNAVRARLEPLAQGNSSIVASLLGRAAKLAWPFDTTELRTAAAADYLAKAQVAAVRRDRRTVDSIFKSIDQSRLRAGPMDVTPDAIYGEARTLLTLGDTAAAASRLDAFLAGKSRLTPGLISRPIALASLLRIMDLRSSLAHGGATAAWQKQLATLWADRDRGLPLTVR